MTTPEIQFKLRLPADLKDRLDSAASAAGRSITAEVVRRLERSFHTDKAAAFELLRKAIDRRAETEKVIARYEADIEKVKQGDETPFKYLFMTDNAAPDQDLLTSVMQIKELFEKDLKRLNETVPVLLAAATKGGHIPTEIYELLDSRD
ncbi:Arc family DNA-binding protein [Pseudoxanthomonas winnipegensis]|uniref:Arc family DNA-binding protein n=1 Tax=Pseudoxanthomonas winnipegensis TaxID=2480810 RepID=UPI00102D6B9D|nr:Arc family DNA-binding protein [Pseudoxanthomonas winnipegensis]TAA43830.1 Arc family DNA-binding protein [Pseudoxanthomonas winnipegensis]